MDEPDKTSLALASLLATSTEAAGVFENYFIDADVIGGNDIEGAITINDMERSSELTRGEAIELFKRIDSLGLGRYKVGRHSKPTRVEIFFDSDDLSNAIDLQGTKYLKEQFEFHKERKRSEALTHAFLLRPDFKVEVTLPPDFSHRDNERMKSWLDTIPF